MAPLRRHEPNDYQWDLIKDFFPPERGKGRPFRSHRVIVNAIFYILCTGAPWRDLPERYGPWQTAYNRFNRWRKEGLVEKILRELQIMMDNAGLIDWQLWCIDGSNIRAHASAAGAGKKGVHTSHRTMLLAAPEVVLVQKSI